MLIELIASTALAAVMSGPPEVVSREYDAVTVEKLLVQNTSGKINITAGDRPRVLIEATKRKFSERCTFETSKSEFEEVIVKVDNPLGDQCEVDISITLPKTVSLNLTSGSGAVNVNGIEGPLYFTLGSGPVQAQGKFSQVRGKSGSGSVEIAGIHGGGEISVGSGAVNLKFLENPVGKFEVKTGSGDAVISLPKAAKINAKLSTGSGQVTNDFNQVEAAEFGVNVRTGSGDVNVRAL